MCWGRDGTIFSPFLPQPSLTQPRPGQVHPEPVSRVTAGGSGNDRAGGKVHRRLPLMSVSPVGGCLVRGRGGALRVSEAAEVIITGGEVSAEPLRNSPPGSPPLSVITAHDRRATQRSRQSKHRQTQTGPNPTRWEASGSRKHTSWNLQPDKIAQITLFKLCFHKSL